MAKARIGLYNTKGDTLTRSHKSCPKCGPGIFLAEHPDRRSCGRCGYMETKPKEASPAAAPAPAGAPKPKTEAKPPKPKAPKPAAAPPSAAPAPAAPKPGA